MIRKKKQGIQRTFKDDLKLENTSNPNLAGLFLKSHIYKHWG
jgi:hypothetical protein